MKLGNLRVIPLPKENAKLRTNGPYSFIRHPMYSGLLLIVVPLVINHFSYLRLLVCIILISRTLKST